MNNLKEPEKWNKKLQQDNQRLETKIVDLYAEIFQLNEIVKNLTKEEK